MVNVPFSSKVSIRAAFATEKHDGFLSQGNADADTRNGRFKVLYQVNEGMSITGTFETARVGGHPTSQAVAPIDVANAWYSIRELGIQDRIANTISLNLNWDLGWGTLNFLPSYQRGYYYMNPYPSMVQANRQNQKSGELRLSNSSDSSFIWVAGANYYTTDEYNVPAMDILDQYDLVVGWMPGGAGGTGDRQENIKQIADSIAAFGQITYPIADMFRAIGGIRHTKDNRIQKYHIYNTTTGYDSGAKDWKKGYSSNTYKGGLEFDVSESSMLYGTVSTGYKAGMLMFMSTTNNYTVKPERLMAYALGSKNRFFNNRWQLNAEAYYYDYKDYQMRYSQQDLSSGRFMMVTTNTDGATSSGLEIENSILLSGSDKLDVNIVYMNTKFREFGYEDMHGNWVDIASGGLPNSPKWSGKIGYEHIFNFDAIDAQVSFGFDSAISRGYYNTFEKSYLGAWVKPYHKTDAYLVYSPQDQKWNLRAYWKNIENVAIAKFAADVPASATTGGSSNAGGSATGGVEGRVGLNDPMTYGFVFSARF